MRLFLMYLWMSSYLCLSLSCSSCIWWENHIKEKKIVVEECCILSRFFIFSPIFFHCSSGQILDLGITNTKHTCSCKRHAVLGSYAREQVSAKAKNIAVVIDITEVSNMHTTGTCITFCFRNFINLKEKYFDCYLPQRGCGKVIFLQASVILFTAGCVAHMH